MQADTQTFKPHDEHESGKQNQRPEIPSSSINVEDCMTSDNAVGLQSSDSDGIENRESIVSRESGDDGGDGGGDDSGSSSGVIADHNSSAPRHLTAGKWLVPAFELSKHRYRALA